MTDVTRPCCKLTLNTNLFYPKSTGSVNGVGARDRTMGDSDAGRLNSVFTNIDWTRVLGDMYYEYKTFNLCLTSVTYCGAGGTPFGANAYGGGIVVRGTGLPWMTTYDGYSRTDIATVDLACYSLARNIEVKTVHSFHRPPPVSDFHIRLYRAADGTQQVGYFDRPAAFVFCFEIYGVERA